MRRKKDNQSLTSLFHELVNRVDQEACVVYTDLTAKKLWVNRTLVVDQSWRGKPFDVFSNRDVMEVIESLYSDYKTSIPGERIEKQRVYKGVQFKALDLDDISEDAFLYGTRRDLALARLEMFVLFATLSERLKWKNEWGTWFWKSPKDRDCVLLKDWIIFDDLNQNQNQ